MSGAERMNEGESNGSEVQGPERPAPLAPPTQGELPPPQRSSWPTVVGILGVIYSCMGVLGVFCGLAYPFVLPWYFDFLRDMGMPEEDVQALDSSMPPIGWTVLANLVGLVLVILLFVGCLKLLRRQALGAKLCTLWGWIVIPWTLVATAITLVLVLGAPAPSSNPGQQIGAVIGVVIGLVLGLVFPVFMVIWFLRPTIKSQVAQWR